MKLLHEEHVLLVHGSGFSPVHGSGHFRLVALPPKEVLNDAFDRIDRSMHPSIRFESNLSEPIRIEAIRMNLNPINLN